MLASAAIKPKYTVIIGTVQGDLHDIGKNLISMMWRGAGFAVIDLGTNVSPERYLAAAQEHQAHIIGLSALLTTTMPAMMTDALRIPRFISSLPSSSRVPRPRPRPWRW